MSLNRYYILFTSCMIIWLASAPSLWAQTFDVNLTSNRTEYKHMEDLILCVEIVNLTSNIVFFPGLNCNPNYVKFITESEVVELERCEGFGNSSVIRLDSCESNKSIVRIRHRNKSDVRKEFTVAMIIQTGEETYGDTVNLFSNILNPKDKAELATVQSISSLPQKERYESMKYFISQNPSSIYCDELFTRTYLFGNDLMNHQHEYDFINQTSQKYLEPQEYNDILLDGARNYSNSEPELARRLLEPAPKSHYKRSIERRLNRIKKNE